MLTDGDAALVAAIASGDEEAASRFDERFRSRIEGIARKKQVPANDCGDVAQNVLVDALRQIRAQKFRGTAALATWLHAIANGKIADYWRGRRGLETVSLTDLSDHDPRLVSRNPSEDVVAVQCALAGLPAAEQIVLLLHEREGYTLEEIGRLMGLRKSAVGERLQKAREHFRAAINDTGSDRTPKRLKGRER